MRIVSGSSAGLPAGEPLAEPAEAGFRVSEILVECPARANGGRPNLFSLADCRSGGVEGPHGRGSGTRTPAERLRPDSFGGKIGTRRSFPVLPSPAFLTRLSLTFAARRIYLRCLVRIIYLQAWTPLRTLCRVSRSTPPPGRRGRFLRAQVRHNRPAFEVGCTSGQSRHGSQSDGGLPPSASAASLPLRSGKEHGL